jgi:hypothetical protein
LPELEAAVADDVADELALPVAQRLHDDVAGREAVAVPRPDVRGDGVGLLLPRSATKNGSKIVPFGPPARVRTQMKAEPDPGAQLCTWYWPLGMIASTASRFGACAAADTGASSPINSRASVTVLVIRPS